MRIMHLKVYSSKCMTPREVRGISIVRAVACSTCILNHPECVLRPQKDWGGPGLVAYASNHYPAQVVNALKRHSWFALRWSACE